MAGGSRRFKGNIFRSYCYFHNTCCGLPANHIPAGFCGKAVPRVRDRGGWSGIDLCLCFIDSHASAQRQTYQEKYAPAFLVL